MGSWCGQGARWSPPIPIVEGDARYPGEKSASRHARREERFLHARVSGRASRLLRRIPPAPHGHHLLPTAARSRRLLALASPQSPRLPDPAASSPSPPRSPLAYQIPPLPPRRRLQRRLLAIASNAASSPSPLCRPLGPQQFGRLAFTPVCCWW